MKRLIKIILQQWIKQKIVKIYPNNNYLNLIKHWIKKIFKKQTLKKLESNKL